MRTLLLSLAFTATLCQAQQPPIGINLDDNVNPPACCQLSLAWQHGQEIIDTIAYENWRLLQSFNNVLHPGSPVASHIFTKAALDSLATVITDANRLRMFRLTDIWLGVGQPPPAPCVYTYSTWSTCTNGTQTRTVLSSTPVGCAGTPVLSQTCTAPPPSGSVIDPNDVLVVWNTADARTQAWATSYATAWGIPSGNVISINAGTSHDATTTIATAIRTAVQAKGEEFTVLAWEYPSRVGSQSITSLVTFGPRNVSSLTVSPLYNYTGVKPRTDKGVAPSFLLVNGNYIRKDAHGSRPTGQSFLLLAKDSSGSPRGVARKGQTATGVTVWDNTVPIQRPGKPDFTMGTGFNACNYLSTLCFLDVRKPSTVPVLAAYQSMYELGDPGAVVWAKGFYGDHVTSFGGFLPGGAAPTYKNGQNQTALTYHLEKGASMSVGSVSEPWQGANGSLAQQFVNVSVFHPLFLSGKPVGVASWAAVQCPDRMLFAGDPLCAPFK